MANGSQILTDLSLRLRTDSAELQKGLNRAKASVKNFKKDTSQAANQVKGIFSEIGGAASAGFSRMGAGFSAMQGALNGSIKAVKGLTGGMSGLKTAIISTGIGAIFVAIGIAIAAVMTYLKGTTDGARKLASVTGYLKGLFAGLKEILIDVGRFLVKMWNDPKQAIIDLWEAIKTNLINRFNGAISYFKAGFSAIANGAKGVAMAIAGIFDKDKAEAARVFFDQMKSDLLEVGKSAVQMATGLDVEKAIEKTGAKFKEINDLAKKGDEIERQKFDLYEKNTAFLIEEANLMNEIATLTDVSSDKELEASISLEATNKAIEVSRELYAKRIALQDEAIQLLKDEQNLGSNTKEDYRELAELEKAKILIIKESTDKERELKNRKEEITARIAAEALAAEMKLQADLKLERDKAEAEEKTRLDSRENYRKQNLARTLEGQLILLEVEKENKLIAENEYIEEKKRLTEEMAARDKQLSAQAIQNAKAEAQAKADAVNSYLDVASQVMTTLGAIYDAQQAREIAAAGDNEERKSAIMRKYARKQKALSMLQAGINMAVGITKAFADGGVLGFITAGLIAAAGAAQIATIAATPLANGGLAYGPVNALVGEYSGARSNPEVIAPLNKLKDILGNSGAGRVIFEIEGTTLKGVLQKQNSIDNNS